MVICNIASLAANASATLNIVVTPQPAVAGTTITNTATAMANELDPNANNNTAVTTTAVTAAMANLSVSKTATPSPAIVNTNLTYTITVMNAGPQAATNIVVTDMLPGGVTFVSASAGCVASPGMVICNIASLAANASATLSIVVTPTAAGTINNTVSVVAAEPDPNTANNTFMLSTTVQIQPFTITIPPGAPTTIGVNSGGTAMFMIDVTPAQPGIVITINCGTPLPPDTTCTVMPSAFVSTGTTPQPVKVTLQTTVCFLTAPPLRGPRFPDADLRLLWPSLLATAVLFWAGVVRRRDALRRWTPAFALLVLVVLLGACASGSAGPSVQRRGPTGTLPGTYTIPVTVSSGGASQTVTFTLKVDL
jgi:uncharacterized repeat protein (TIGR01451 family)